MKCIFFVLLLLRIMNHVNVFIIWLCTFFSNITLLLLTFLSSSYVNCIVMYVIVAHADLLPKSYLFWGGKLLEIVFCYTTLSCFVFNPLLLVIVFVPRVISASCYRVIHNVSPPVLCVCISCMKRKVLCLYIIKCLWFFVQCYP